MLWNRYKGVLKKCEIFTVSIGHRRSKCVIIPNFAKIGPTAPEITYGNLTVFKMPSFRFRHLGFVTVSADRTARAANFRRDLEAT